MFFIGGISDGIRELFYPEGMYCRICGERTKVRIMMTYFYFSFFFIPLFQWGRKFYLEKGCCRRRYELSYEKGMQLLRGQEVEITEADLTFAEQG